jgi:hypothetical protein
MANADLKALDRKIEEFARMLDITGGASSVDVAAVMVRGFHQKHTYRREARLHGASDLLRIVGALEKYRAFSAEALMKELEAAREPITSVMPPRPSLMRRIVNRSSASDSGQSVSVSERRHDHTHPKRVPVNIYRTELRR